MDWQKVYKGEASHMSWYLTRLLCAQPPVNRDDYESDESRMYGAEWTERDEVLWAWKELQKKMNYLDATTKEIPV